MTTVLPFPVRPAAHTVSDVAKISDEDKLYAVRLGHVLRTLREEAGLRQADVEEALTLSEGTVGRWERGAHAPKGYNFGRLFRFFETYGAELDMFLDPPEVVVTNPVLARLRASTPPRPALVPTPAEKALAAKVIRSGIEEGERLDHNQRPSTQTKPAASRRRPARAK